MTVFIVLIVFVNTLRACNRPSAHPRVPGAASHRPRFPGSSVRPGQASPALPPAAPRANPRQSSSSSTPVHAHASTTIPLSAVSGRAPGAPGALRTPAAAPAGFGGIGSLEDRRKTDESVHELETRIAEYSSRTGEDATYVGDVLMRPIKKQKNSGNSRRNFYIN